MPILELLTTEIASALLADDGFSPSTCIREQYFHACRIFRDQNHALSFSA
jgi:hypothetical protein